jgi:hypothetical protein
LTDEKGRTRKRSALLAFCGIVAVLATSGCAAEPERECPTFAVDGQGEFHPGGSAPTLGEFGLIELAVGLCAYDDQHLLVAFAPSSTFAKDYLLRVRTLLGVRGADIQETSSERSSGFFAGVPAEQGADELNLTVTYIPQVSQDDFGDGLELADLGLEPGDGFLVVGYS